MSETMFLRVPPALKAAVVAQVDGLNKARSPGDPEHTVNSFVCGVLFALFDVGIATGKKVRK
jgi:hypothetical protein